MQLKVGELAKRSGVSVRTLHHYDEIGLLSPSLRTESGHRLYTDVDIQRLQQIISLKSMAFSLDAISEFLQNPDSSPMKILDMHLSKLQQELFDLQKLMSQLERVVGSMKAGDDPKTEDLLKLIEGMTMIEKYYSQEQFEQLQQRAEAFGEAKMSELENEWAVLIEKVRAEMQRGSDPASESVQQLAKQWQGLIELFTGGDAGIGRSLQTMYKKEGAAKASRGAVDEEVCAYIHRAINQQ